MSENISRVRALDEDYYHRPRVCKECGGVMVFQGVGEYRCEDCSAIAYDDYGIVRKYIEQHPGATTAVVEEKTGVKKKTILHMLRESRLQVATDSKSFLKCGMCGQQIRTGIYCPKCEVRYHRLLEEEQRRMHYEARVKEMHGYSTRNKTESVGERRYSR